MVAPLSTSPPPKGSGAPLAPAAPGTGSPAAAPWAGAGGAGVQSGSKPLPGGSPGTDTGEPLGGGGGARYVPAPPDESPGAFCVYQAGGV